MDSTPQEWTIRETLQRECLPEPRVAVLRANDDRMRVAIGIPMERTMLQEAFFGFAAILQQGWSLAQLPYTRNDVARHKLAQFLLKSDYTHLLMLDSDHVHPVDIVPRLARWFQAYPDLRVVGGLNFRRGEPFDPCAFVDPGDGEFHRMAEWGRGLVRVDALGTGSMMIDRRVFEALPEDAGWFDYAYPNHSQWPGTDMTFSARCREAGIGLWCDTTCTSPHIGTMLIDASTYRAYLAQQIALAEQQAAAVPQTVTI
jgi:hypothetical protein